MSSETCLVLHRKSANEPAIKEAVNYVRGKGIDLEVRIPWNKKAKHGAHESSSACCGYSRNILLKS